MAPCREGRAEIGKVGMKWWGKGDCSKDFWINKISEMPLWQIFGSRYGTKFYGSNLSGSGKGTGIPRKLEVEVGSR